MKGKIDWVLIRSGCPYCDSKLQYHALTVWCLRCGFGCNWENWPAKKRAILIDAGRVSRGDISG